MPHNSRKPVFVLAPLLLALGALLVSACGDDGGVACQEGETQTGTVPCGLNDRGVYNQVCKQGQWASVCDDPDACTDGDTQTDPTPCGLNGRGVIEETCREGQWEGTCEDPDACTDDDVRPGTTPCGLNDRGAVEQVCAQGQWEDSANCDDPDVCTDGDTQTGTAPCGLNDRGTIHETCREGQWEGACDDPDVCTDDDIQPSTTPCGLNGRGTIDQVCTVGQWEEDCNDPDVCTDDEVQPGTTPCGLNGRGTIDRICTVGQWEDACDDPDVCTDDDVQPGTTPCGPYDQGALDQICTVGQWVDTTTCTGDFEYIFVSNYYDLVHRANLFAGGLAPLSVAGFLAPQGMAVAADGDILVADYVFDGVHRLDPLTNVRSAFATGLGNPWDVAAAPSGEAFVTRTTDLLRLDASGSLVQTYSYALSEMDPVVTVADDGTVYVFRSDCLAPDPMGICEPDDPNVGEILALDPSDGAFWQVASGGSLNSPGGIAIDQNGLLFVGTSEGMMGRNGRIVRVDPSTGAQQVIYQGFEIMQPYALAFTRGGDLLVVDRMSAQVVRIDPGSGGVLATIGGCASPCLPQGIAYLHTTEPLP
jgi:DNA-binding beta-propeller fold protein YncE